MISLSGQAVQHLSLGVGGDGVTPGGGGPMDGVEPLTQDPALLTASASALDAHAHASIAAACSLPLDPIPLDASCQALINGYKEGLQAQAITTLQQQMQYPGLVSSAAAGQLVTAVSTDGSGLMTATTAGGGAAAGSGGGQQPGGQQIHPPTFSVGLDQLLQQNQFCKSHYLSCSKTSQTKCHKQSGTVFQVCF